MSRIRRTVEHNRAYSRRRRRKNRHQDALRCPRIDDPNHGAPSGREFIGARFTLGLNPSLQNCPCRVHPGEFGDGWREKLLVDMSDAELAVFFGEFSVLVMCETAVQ